MLLFGQIPSFSSAYFQISNGAVLEEIDGRPKICKFESQRTFIERK